MANVRRLAAASLASSAAAIALLACTTAVSPLPASEQRAQAIDNSLICPICPGETIDRSQVQLAKDMQVIVREQIAEGRSDDEIRQFFVDRYGERVLAAPPREGFHWLVWGLPPVGIVLGLLALFRVTQLMGRRTSEGEAVPDGGGGSDLSPYMRQVEQELAHGGPQRPSTGSGRTDGGSSGRTGDVEGAGERRGSRLRGNDGLGEDVGARPSTGSGRTDEGSDGAAESAERRGSRPRGNDGLGEDD